MPDRRAHLLLRVAVAVLLGIHGFYRLGVMGPPDFGAFLASKGIPFGTGLAWAVTVYEMTGSVLLATGRLVRPVAAGFMAILAGGIVLVHAREGWFVVGGGRNGVEYSVLLLACLACLFLAERPGERPEPGAA